MSDLLFYQKPVALNREAHKETKVKPLTDFSFSQDVNSVPLTGIEFFEASRDYPVLFSKDQDDNYFPIVMLSLENDGHSQLNDEGGWTESYAPAFIRRYPFALSEDGTVCFDEESALFGDEGEALFDEEGENTETLNQVISFLNHYDAQHKATREFAEALKEADLFKPFNLQVMKKEETPLRLEGLHIIDEEKMNQLDDATVAEWFKKAWIAWAYAHLHSLGALAKLAK